MNFEKTTIPLIPRTTSNCLDLAIKFYRQHFDHIGELCLSVALPSGFLVYLLSVRLEMDVRLTICVLYFATLPLGVLLIAGSTRAVFGESFTPPRESSTKTARFSRTAMRLADGLSVVLFLTIVFDYLAERLGTDLLPTERFQLAVVGMLIFTLSLRLVLLMIRYARFSPGLIGVLLSGFFRRLAMAIGPGLVMFGEGAFLVILGLGTSLITLVFLVRTSFQPEVKFLSRLDRHLGARQAKKLMKSESGDLFLRSCWIGLFCMLVTFTVFLTVDRGCEILLGFPILWGRLVDVLPTADQYDGVFPYAVEFTVEVIQFAMSDSRALTVLTAVVMLVYPIGRLAWFFCYLDVRVRRDLWDLELQFHQAAEQLERTSL